MILTFILMITPIIGIVPWLPPIIRAHSPTATPPAHATLCGYAPHFLIPCHTFWCAALPQFAHILLSDHQLSSCQDLPLRILSSNWNLKSFDSTTLFTVTHSLHVPFFPQHYAAWISWSVFNFIHSSNNCICILQIIERILKCCFRSLGATLQQRSCPWSPASSSSLLFTSVSSLGKTTFKLTTPVFMFLICIWSDFILSHSFNDINMLTTLIFISTDWIFPLNLWHIYSKSLTPLLNA